MMHRKAQTLKAQTQLAHFGGDSLRQAASGRQTQADSEQKGSPLQWSASTTVVCYSQAAAAAAQAITGLAADVQLSSSSSPSSSPAAAKLSNYQCHYSLSEENQRGF